MISNGTKADTFSDAKMTLTISDTFSKAERFSKTHTIFTKAETFTKPKIQILYTEIH